MITGVYNSPGHGQRAVVMGQVARDVNASPVVVDGDEVAATHDSCVANAHWHLDTSAIDGDLGIGEDLDLFSGGDD